jgi:hypothetical protein
VTMNLKLGCIISKPVKMGDIPTADDHVLGIILLDDWSGKYRGPFLDPYGGPLLLACPLISASSNGLIDQIHIKAAARLRDKTVSPLSPSSFGEISDPISTARSWLSFQS